MKYLLTGEETSRLRFRLVEDADFDTWLPLFETQEAATFLGLDKTLSPRELCEAWFTKLKHRYTNGLGGMNALIDKTTGAFIGQCGLLVQTVEEEQKLEIGYSILPQYWGKGYATEAATKCKDFAFTHAFADHLISIVHLDNIASATVARKNGMRIEKTVANYKNMPVNVFRIDLETWSKNR